MSQNTRGARAFFAGVCLLVGACAAETSESSDVLPVDLGVSTLDPATGNGDDPNGDEPGGPSGPSVAGCPDGKWCSSLYGPDWSATDPADAQGRFLHDFSYAGYRNGEAPPATPPGETFDVVAYGADASGSRDATAAVQAAIAAASSAGGGVVFFPQGTYRIDQTLTVSASGVVLRGTGTTSVLRFAKASGMAYKAGLTFSGSITRSASKSLVADAPMRATEVLVADASGYAAGDDVAVGWTITPKFIAEHGMTGTWTSFTNKYQPIFKRKVVSVDTSSSPNRIVLDVPLRYAAKTRDGASIQKETGYLREVGVESLGVTNATSWSAAWAENQVYAIAMRDVADSWMRDVHSVATPGTGKNASDKTQYHLRSSGLFIGDSKRVSVLSSSMELPQNRGSGGNGYLYEVSQTSEVLIADCYANRGRHNFIQNWGFGNSGTVFLRCTSVGSEMLSLIGGSLQPERAASEHHHSLSMATLVDGCRLDDGFISENRGSYSDGAGHTGTGSVVWGGSGTGRVISRQFGWGYVIGTHPGLEVDTNMAAESADGTAPADFVEGKDKAATLSPASLYEDQRARRLR